MGGAGRDAPPDASRSAYFDRVFAIVAAIPHGRVTTYGTIARALGTPRSARVFGWALKAAPDAASLPCHRVVDRDGNLSGGWHFGHPDIMADRLREEDVPFVAPYRVDLAACLWDPAEGPGSTSPVWSEHERHGT
jgi:methylated-DNA-protein-cysteine methyltransferase-like protein